MKIYRVAMLLAYLFGCLVPMLADAQPADVTLFEGDILMSARPNAVLVAGQNHYWINGTVPFEWSNTLPAHTKQAAVDAMDYWQRHANVTFVEMTEQNRHDYRDYVAFVPDSGQLCASFVGRRGGRQVVQLSSRCDFRILLHELGHVLGLWHEQSRSDRDQYVRILWENIEERARYNFEKRPADGVDYKEYDYHSIMHYSPYAFSKNGKKTIEPLLPGVIIGQQLTLSGADLAAVNAIYPGPLG